MAEGQKPSDSEYLAESEVVRAVTIKRADFWLVSL
jgi:hypothetical protein